MKLEEQPTNYYHLVEIERLEKIMIIEVQEATDLDSKDWSTFYTIDNYKDAAMCLIDLLNENNATAYFYRIIEVVQ